MLNLNSNSSGYPKAHKRVLVLSIAFLLIATMTVPLTNAATITTAKLVYYYPDDLTVDIAGSDFIANHEISIQVTISENTEYQFSDSLTSNPDGSFVYTYNLPGIIGTYIVTATDGTNAAETTFLDPKAVPTIALSPTSGPVGTTVTVNGEKFKQGDTITITFDGSPVATVPATVTVSGNSFSCTFVVPSSTTGGKTVTATATNGDTDSDTFTVTTEIPEYSLTVNIIGSGSVSVNGSSPYAAGSTVQLTANPAAGWGFVGWSGDLSGSANPEYLTMDANKSVTATFGEIPEYSLTVNVVGTGAVTVNPDLTSYVAGTDVELTALETDPGWKFIGWSGDLSGSTNPETIKMDANKTVIATFTEIQPDVRDVEAVSQTVTENEVMPGDLVDIDVTVRNNGDVTETFDLTCVANGITIGTVRVIDLAPGETRVVKFTWDTTGVPMNGYPITAFADSSAEIVEIDEANNWCTMPLNIFVIPELPLGTILAALSMFAALVGYVGFKRYRTK